MTDGTGDLRMWLWGLASGIVYVLVFTKPHE